MVKIFELKVLKYNFNYYLNIKRESNLLLTISNKFKKIMNIWILPNLLSLCFVMTEFYDF